MKSWMIATYAAFIGMTVGSTLVHVTIVRPRHELTIEGLQTALLVTHERAAVRAREQLQLMELLDANDFAQARQLSGRMLGREERALSGFMPVAGNEPANRVILDARQRIAQFRSSTPIR